MSQSLSHPAKAETIESLDQELEARSPRLMDTKTAVHNKFEILIFQDQR